MFHVALFACLSGLFLLFAFSAGRADQFLIAVPAALMALWMGDSTIRAARRARERRRMDRMDAGSNDVDGRQ